MTAQRDLLAAVLAEMDDGLAPLHACDEASCPGYEQHADALVARGIRVVDVHGLGMALDAVLGQRGVWVTPEGETAAILVSLDTPAR